MKRKVNGIYSLRNNGNSFLRIASGIYMRGEWPAWLRHCATRRVVPGSIPGKILGKFPVTYFCPHLVALGSTQPLTERNFFVGKVRPARRAENSAVIFVPNVKLSTEV
jgi:hypothetical protein